MNTMKIAKWKFGLKRFQFSLRTLLILILLLSGFFWWLSKNLNIAHRQELTVAKILESGGLVAHQYDIEDPWGNKQSDLLETFKVRSLLGLNFMNPVEEVFFIVNSTCDKNILHLTELQQIKSLSVLSSDLTDLGLQNIKFQDNLSDLILIRTHITDIGIASLKRFKNLKILRLSHNQISDKGLVHLQHLVLLEELALHGTLITDDGLVYLKSLKNIKYLGIANTNISDTGLSHLAGLTKLEELSLANTNISDTGLIEIAKIKNLKYVDLSGTRITENGRKKLQLALPSLKIHITQGDIYQIDVKAPEKFDSHESTVLFGMRIVGVVCFIFLIWTGYVKYRRASRI